MEALAAIIGLFYGALFLIGLPYLFFSLLKLRDKNSLLESRVDDLQTALRDLQQKPFPDLTDETETSDHSFSNDPISPSQDQVSESHTDAWDAATDEEKFDPDFAKTTQHAYSQPTANSEVATAPFSTNEEEPVPSKQYVLNPENLTRLQNWLRANWTLAIAALSMILGGFFMVQYGVENGLLTPPLRVIGALLLGAMLIGGGEFLRRKHGDLGSASIQHLPSTLAGAGVVILFIAVLSAHALYGLISALSALIGLALVSLVAIAMGWLYGPVLSAIGILGASAAPFLVQGDADSGLVLYPYFALIALIGLSIDTLKRWAWVSALALAAPTVSIALLWLADPQPLALICSALVIALAAITIPNRSVTPMHSGPSSISHFLKKGRAHFTTLLAAAGVLIVSVAALVVALTRDPLPEIWLGLVVLLLLCALTLFWFRRAPALEELALLPPVFFIGWLFFHAKEQGALFLSAHLKSPPTMQVDLTSAPVANNTIWWLVLFAAMLSFFAFIRMHLHIKQTVCENSRVDHNTPFALRFDPWAMAAAALLPIGIFVLEFLWVPSTAYGETHWALGIVIASLLLIYFARHRAQLGGDGKDLDCGLFAASALSLIALALFVVLTKTALTLGLSFVILLASLINRRYKLPPLGWMIQIGIAVIGYRLLIDPGFQWSLNEASFLNFLLAYLGPIAALIGILLITKDTHYAQPNINENLTPDQIHHQQQRSDRQQALIRSVAESALISFGGIFLTLFLARLIDAKDFLNHWGYGVSAMIWFSSAIAQLWRLPHSSGKARLVRLGFVVVFLLSGFSMLMKLLDHVSMMLNWSFEKVIGPPIFDSLALAFLPLAMLCAITAKWLATPERGMPDWLRTGLYVAGSSLIVFWGWLEIRRLWRGTDLSVAGPSDGELYTYTIAMLLISLGLLFYAFIKRSITLRKLAMIGVALTIAKVFLIDMSGLSGLVRVAAFMGLGLALVALAWFNRVINENWTKQDRA